MSVKRKRVAEVDLARDVVTWLRDSEWDVYQEVSEGYASRRADIVATRGPLVWVIECKAVLGWRLVEQASWWLGQVHYTSVAIPHWPRGCGFARKVLADYGIGAFVGAEMAVAPRLFRKARCKIRECLCDAQKTIGEAGSAGGGYWTPFNETCRAVAAFAKANPGCTTKELVAGIEHHYHRDATARSALVKWIGRGIVKGVRLEIEGGKARIYSNEPAEVLAL